MIFRRWIGVLSMALWGVGAMAPGALYAGTDGYTLEDFKLRSAADLVDVCTLETRHENYTAAQAFCYGFFEGVIRYDEAISGLEYYEDIVCEPSETTRLQAVQVFVDYIEENPQYIDDAPTDVIFRALKSNWPCAE